MSHKFASHCSHLNRVHSVCKIKEIPNRCSEEGTSIYCTEIQLRFHGLSVQLIFSIYFCVYSSAKTPILDKCKFWSALAPALLGKSYNQASWWYLIHGCKPSAGFSTLPYILFPLSSRSPIFLNDYFKLILTLLTVFSSSPGFLLHSQQITSLA